MYTSLFILWWSLHLLLYVDCGYCLFLFLSSWMLFVSLQYDWSSWLSYCHASIVFISVLWKQKDKTELWQYYTVVTEYSAEEEDVLQHESEDITSQHVPPFASPGETQRVPTPGPSTPASPHCHLRHKGGRLVCQNCHCWWLVFFEDTRKPTTCVHQHSCTIIPTLDCACDAIFDFGSCSGEIVHFLTWQKCVTLAFLQTLCEWDLTLKKNIKKMIIKYIELCIPWPKVIGVLIFLRTLYCMTSFSDLDTKVKVTDQADC